MNFQITSLAEEMSATEFVIELDNQGINWEVVECDNAMNYNEDECIITIGDMSYQFLGGELTDVYEHEF
jgi:hypothetical protein